MFIFIILAFYNVEQSECVSFRSTTRMDNLNEGDDVNITASFQFDTDELLQVVKFILENKTVIAEGNVNQYNVTQNGAFLFGNRITTSVYGYDYVTTITKLNINDSMNFIILLLFKKENVYNIAQFYISLDVKAVPVVLNFPKVLHIKDGESLSVETIIYGKPKPDCIVIFKEQIYVPKYSNETEVNKYQFIYDMGVMNSNYNGSVLYLIVSGNGKVITQNTSLIFPTENIFKPTNMEKTLLETTTPYSPISTSTFNTSALNTSVLNTSAINTPASSTSAISTSAIVGIVIGCFLFVVIILLLLKILVCQYRKKNKWNVEKVEIKNDDPALTEDDDNKSNSRDPSFYEDISHLQTGLSYFDNSNKMVDSQDAACVYQNDYLNPKESVNNPNYFMLEKVNSVIYDESENIDESKRYNELENTSEIGKLDQPEICDNSQSNTLKTFDENNYYDVPETIQS
ncbi:uncharacterized protein LOC100210419 isoform X1 [Hydra vulgaris]|uniref:uncharacterized protein LOC100210419 isoform X1 n=2 Tax=Hydra vulgaris TaxID=6087 RepID=UPI001F5EAB21|nr:uncharacterized protein LOC100210419 isoform X1 [Hydra vulgaris]